MKKKILTVPELVLIAGTRVALGAGLGFLLGEKLGPGVRKGAGWALFAVGVLSTVPLAVGVLGSSVPKAVTGNE